MNWQLNISDEQAEVLIKALDMYSRMGMGQLGIALEGMHGLNWDDRKALQSIFEQFAGSNFHGINSPKTPDGAKVSWDMMQVIRQQVSWNKVGKNPNVDKRDWEIMTTVDYDEPMPSSTDVPLCEMKRIEEE